MVIGIPITRVCHAFQLCFKPAEYAHKMSVRDLIQQWDVVSGSSLNGVEANQLLREAGIHVTDAIAARSPDEAAAAARDLGFPFHLSPLSRERFPAQADGVTQVATSEADVQHAYQAVLNASRAWNPGAAVDGVLLKCIPRPGVEMTVAVEQDVLFGPVLSFGFGRMAMDIWDDVAYRIVPITDKDARLIIKEPKASTLLQGYGALEAPKVALVERLLLQVSDLVESTPEILEMELDPVYSYRDEIVVAGARIALRNPDADK